jgi:hypothetical protein
MSANYCNVAGARMQIVKRRILLNGEVQNIILRI